MILRRYVVVAGALAIAAVACGAWLIYDYGLTNGPLYQDGVRTGHAWYSEGVPSRGDRYPVLFGGYVFNNKTGHPITIVAVNPTNIPVGTRLIATGMLIAQPEVIGGYLGAHGEVLDPASPNSMTLASRYDVHPLPFTIQPGTTWWEPIIALSSLLPGDYTVSGILISYRSSGRKYVDYFPDEFTLCVNNQHKCFVEPPPPPTHWHSRGLWDLPLW